MAMRQRIIEISLVMMMAVVFTSCTNESRNEGLNQVKFVLESGINSNSENIEETSEKDEVTVVGVFDTYKEGARTYKTLRKAYMCDAV